MNIEIYPRKLFTKFLYLILILLFANVIGIVSKFYFDHDNIYELIPWFDFDTELNIPTIYSSFALIFVSILFSIIASTHKRLGSSYFPWLVLAIIFLFLSIDEIASIHERIGVPVRKSLSTSGLLFYAWVIPYGNAWVIPYGIALVVFVITYFRFLMSLPNKIMIFFVVSGATFVAGAIGFELLGGRHHDLYGTNNLIYSLLYTCEEFLEMLGIVIFIYTLLLYIASQFKYFTITINEQR